MKMLDPHSKIADGTRVVIATSNVSALGVVFNGQLDSSILLNNGEVVIDREAILTIYTAVDIEDDNG